jgi:hypothetical protein
MPLLESRMIRNPGTRRLNANAHRIIAITRRTTNIGIAASPVSVLPTVLLPFSGEL